MCWSSDTMGYNLRNNVYLFPHIRALLFTSVIFPQSVDRLSKGGTIVLLVLVFLFLVFFFWWWATPPHSCSRHRDCRPWKTAAKCLVLWLVFCSGVVVVVVVIRQVPKRKGNTAVSHSGHFFPPTHVDPYPQACISLAQISCTFPDPTLHTDRYTLLPLNLDKIAFDNGGGGVFIRRIIDLAHRHRS